MSAFNVIQTSRMSDAAIIKLFSNLGAEFGVRNGQLEYGRGVTVKLTQLSEKDEKSRKKATYGISSADLYADKCNLRFLFRRGISHNIDQMDNGARSSSAFVDEIGIQVLPQTNNAGTPEQPTPDQVIAATNLIEQGITRLDPNLVSQTASGATEVLQATFTRMTEFFQDRVTSLEDQRLQIQQLADERAEKQDEELRKERDALAELRKRLEAEYDAKRDELLKQQKALDDRNSRHVRRDLRNEITGEIKTRLSDTSIASKGNKFARIAVPSLSLSAAVILGCSAFLSFSELSQFIDSTLSFNKFVSEEAAQLRVSPENGANAIAFKTDDVVSTFAFWSLFVRAVLSSAGAVAFVAYVISWFRRLHEDDVAATRRLEYYGYDISRASWAVETIMDMRGQEGLEPPNALIDGVCRNLFQSGKSSEGQTSEVADALALLLGKNGKAKFGSSGSDFEFTGPDIGKALKRST
jgi:hypothetical protein